MLHVGDYRGGIDATSIQMGWINSRSFSFGSIRGDRVVLFELHTVCEEGYQTIMQQILC